MQILALLIWVVSPHPCKLKTGPPSVVLTPQGWLSEQNIPLHWNAESSSQILWKTPIPGVAHSSPIIWGKYLFLTTAISTDPKSEFRYGLYGDVEPAKDVSSHSWRVYCLDKRTGKVLWERVAHEGIPKVKRHTEIQPGVFHSDDGWAAHCGSLWCGRTLLF